MTRAAAADLQSSAMLLAGDVGGTKTFLGLFARGDTRPDAVEARSYRTLDFPDLGALVCSFLARRPTRSGRHRGSVSFGVAGPIAGTARS